LSKAGKVSRDDERKATTADIERDCGIVSRQKRSA